MLPSNSTQVPKLSVVLSDTNATYTIEPNSTLPGSTNIIVVAENAKTTKTIQLILCYIVIFLTQLLVLLL